MPAEKSFMQRAEDYRPSKTLMFWGCLGCVIATMVVGFSWGGWVTGGTAGTMASSAATGARAELVASVCADRFGKAADATEQLASLKKADRWDQDKFIEKGGWVTLPGGEKPVAGAATLCVRQLVDATPTTPPTTVTK